MHTVMIAYLLLLPALVFSCQENSLNVGDQTLILIDSLYNINNEPADVKDWDVGSGSKDNDIGSGLVATDSCICTGPKRYSCLEFDKASVQLVGNNTIVAINSSITLRSNITFSNFTNVSIIGYDKNVEILCELRSAISFDNCNNISIQNITWNQCGYNVKHRYFFFPPNFDKYFFSLYYSGLSFKFCTNINFNSCTFIDSMVVINNALSGTVFIDQTHFFSTNTVTLNFTASLATGIIIRQDNQAKPNNNLVVKFTNTLFSQVSSKSDNHALLALYILVDDPDSTIQVLVYRLNFTSISFRPGWETENGMFWIRILSCRDANIYFFKVKFHSNRFRSRDHDLPTTLLHIDITAYKVSQVISGVVVESCSFLNNSADNVAHFEGDMYLNVTNSYFSNNKASRNIILVTTSFYDGYLSTYITTAVKVLQCAFYNNTGGALISLNGDYILVIMAGVQMRHNVLLPSDSGLIMFQNYNTLVANINDIMCQFNSIEGDSSGFRFISKTNIEDPVEIDGDAVIPYKAYTPPNFKFSVVPTVYCDYYYYYSHDYYCQFDDYYQYSSFTKGSFINNTGEGHSTIIHFVVPQFGYHRNFVNMISTSVFNHNSGFTSLIYATTSGFASVTLAVEDCTFVHNIGSVFYLQNQILKFLKGKRSTVFDNNIAENGAALYLDLNSVVIFSNSSTVTFSNNVARRYGGAIYYDITQSSDACYRNLSAFVDDNNTLVDFRNNFAGIAGNSMYFSISQLCNATLQYDSSILNSPGDFITPPSQLRLYYPAELVNNADLYYVSDIMLGQKIIISGCVVDYHGMPAGSVQFTVQLVDNSNDQNNYYTISVSDFISFDCRTSQEIVITGSQPPNNTNSTLEIQLNSFYDSRFDWKPITVNLIVQLSSCHSGFYYSRDLEHCVCYTTDDIVTCSDSNSSIRNGYWFGTINDQPTVTVCPVNYCNFDNCEATTGTCDLYPLRDNQCRGHRSGAACGNCEEGYTLPFDFIDCISIDQCTIGQAVLVITMSFLYWITVIVAVFCMMYFKIGIGYLYGITFFYSIIDVVLGNSVLSSDSLYQLVATLSSVAKLLPQFLGRLCFVKGLSGIDQQFIHYIHPLAILLMLTLISISTRYSPKLSLFVSRAIIHAICLLLLLSYSSIASTSLLLVRAIRFIGVDQMYSYLSPDIEYFHGRHLVYVLIAILIGIVIVIGLPLLLLLEPFLNSKINFIKIKPLLDQFQGCYKDRFRYFSSYFLIFRLIILGILAINQPNSFITLFSLQVICIIMILIHVTVRPYNNNYLNFFDSFMVLILVLVISLQIVKTYYDFSPDAALGMTFVLVILPLCAFLLIVMYLHVENIKKLIVCLISAIKSSKNADNPINESTEMHQFETIVDQNARDKSKTTIV